MDSRTGHEFQPPSPGDSRSPCPALNAAANHSYLPHSGKRLTLSQLIRAIRELYGLSYPLAVLLSLGGILLCGSGGKLDLEQLSKHNKIEHDASLVHEDLRTGDNKNVSPKLVDELIAQSSDGHALSLQDFAQVRAKREAQAPPLDKIHSRFAMGESVLSVMILGDGKKLPCETARTWYGEEKLPAGWAPHGTLGLLKLVGLNRAFGHMVEEAKRSK